MTRRITKKGKVVVDADSCISKTIPDGSDDDDDDDDPRKKKIIRNKKEKGVAAGFLKSQPYIERQ